MISKKSSTSAQNLARSERTRGMTQQKQLEAMGVDKQMQEELAAKGINAGTILKFITKLLPVVLEFLSENQSVPAQAPTDDDKEPPVPTKKSK